MTTQPQSFKGIFEFHMQREGHVDVHGNTLMIQQFMDELQLSETEAECLENAVTLYLLMAIQIGAHLTPEQLTNFGSSVDTRMEFLRHAMAVRPLVMTPMDLERIRNEGQVNEIDEALQVTGGDIDTESGC